MAVTLTRPALAVALRIVVSEGETLTTGQTATLDRLLAAASTLVEQYAPHAPASLHNEAAIRIAGYLFDTDPAESRRVASPLLYSGAAALLSRCRPRRLVDGW